MKNISTFQVCFHKRGDRHEFSRRLLLWGYYYEIQRNCEFCLIPTGACKCYIFF